MFYNIVYSKELLPNNCIDCLNAEDFSRFVDAYNTGDREFFCQGETMLIAGIKKVNVYDTSDCPENASREDIVARMNKLANSGQMFSIARPSVYPSFGKEVTDEYIKGTFGYKGQPQKKETRTKSVRRGGEVLTDGELGKIFCSHSSFDHEIVNKFCTLILSNGLGIKLSTDVFNTSLDGSMPASGEDFRQRIKHELTKARIVLQFISQNYKKSEVCLNEMGAAWVLSHRIVPLILENYDVGFINSTTQQVKLHDEQRVIAFVQDNKQFLCPNEEINISSLTRTAKEFVHWLNEHESKISQNKSDVSEEAQNEQMAAAKTVVTLPPSKPKFYKVDEHAHLYYLVKGELREVPDDLTLYFLGYKPRLGAIKVKSAEVLGVKIGTPMLSVLLSGVVSAEREKAYAKQTTWLLYGSSRHMIANPETLKKLLFTPTQGGVAKRVVKYLPHTTLDKIGQGNIIDLSAEALAKLQ